MLHTTIIGNLTKKPELRTVNTANGPVSVCDIDVAINGRKDRDGNKTTTFVRLTAWRTLAETIVKWADVGTKIAATTDDIHANAYMTKNNTAAASLEGTLVTFEFCGGGKNANTTAPASASQPAATAEAPQPTPVEAPDELPF